MRHVILLSILFSLTLPLFCQHGNDNQAAGKILSGCELDGVLIISEDSSTIPWQYKMEQLRYRYWSGISNIGVSLPLPEKPSWIRVPKTYEYTSWTHLIAIVGFQDSLWMVSIFNGDWDNKSLDHYATIYDHSIVDAVYVQNHLFTAKHFGSGTVIYKWTHTAPLPSALPQVIDSLYLQDSLIALSTYGDEWNRKLLAYCVKSDTGKIKYISAASMNIDDEIILADTLGIHTTFRNSSISSSFIFETRPVYMAAIQADTLFVHKIDSLTGTLIEMNKQPIQLPVVLNRGANGFYYTEQIDSTSSRIIELYFEPAYKTDTLTIPGNADVITDGMLHIFSWGPSSLISQEYLWFNRSSNDVSMYDPADTSISSLYTTAVNWLFIEGLVSCVGGISNTRPYPLRIYPNPTASHITIETADLDKSQLYTLEVFDIMGRIQLREAVEAGDALQVDLSAFTPGLYVVALSGQTVRFTARVVRQ